MCFNTEIADPTQQPIRVVQSHEVQDSEESGDVNKVHKPYGAYGKRSKSSRATEEKYDNGGNMYDNNEGARDGDGGRKKSMASADGSPDSPKKHMKPTRAELDRMYAPTRRSGLNAFGF